MIKFFNFQICPSSDFTCPCCDANGCCMLDNPELECEDYIVLNGID